MTGKERVKAYFEEAIKTDEALKNAYDEKKIDACWTYITSKARSAAKGGCACIEDTEVFKWARDYMYGDIEQEKKVENSVVENEAEDTVSEVKSNDSAEEAAEESEQPEETSNESSRPSDSDKLLSTSTESVPAVDDGETSTEDFVVVSDGEIKHRCNECGYIHITESCHQDEGLCLFKRNNGFADHVVKLQSIACSQFIKLATEDDVKPIKEKLQIEKVEEIKSVETKPEKSKKEDYDGPYLFDFMND